MELVGWSWVAVELSWSWVGWSWVKLSWTGWSWVAVELSWNGVELELELSWMELDLKLELSWVGQTVNSFIVAGRELMPDVELNEPVRVIHYFCCLVHSLFFLLLWWKHLFSSRQLAGIWIIVSVVVVYDKQRFLNLGFTNVVNTGIKSI